MKRHISLIILLALAAFGWLSGAAQTASPLRCTTADVGECIRMFNEGRSALHRAAHFKVWDVDEDGAPELVLATLDRERRVAYRPGRIPQIVPIKSLTAATAIKPSTDPVIWLDLSSVCTMGVELTADPTLTCFPLLCNEIWKEDNIFQATFDEYTEPDPDAVPHPGEYNMMFFKHRSAPVKLNEKAEQTNSFHSFRLLDPAQANVMMRGYNDSQAVPVAVPGRFFDSHSLCQYTRWLDGEPVKMAQGEHFGIIRAHFAPMTVFQTRWLAACDDLRTTYYSVTFTPREGDFYALAAFVAITDGRISSVRLDFTPNDTTDGLWYGGDIDQYFEHAPQIMAIARTDLGTELYVRWESMEGTHYAIWREVAGTWLDITDHWVMYDCEN